MDELDSNATQNQDNTTEHGNERQDSNALLNLPAPEAEIPAPSKHCHPYHASKPSPPWWKRVPWQLIVEVMVFAVGVKVAYIYSGQLTAMLDSNKTNREALISVQRAFVFVGNSEIARVVVGKKINHFTIKTVWENSGTTPTKLTTTHVSFQSWTGPGGIPDDFTFPDSWSEGVPHINTEVFIGPKGITSVITPPISATILEGIKNHSARFYIWGWAKYRDIFNDTPEHITEFCTELSRFTGDPMSLDPNVQPILDNCERHNCYDDQCNDYKEMILNP